MDVILAGRTGSVRALVPTRNCNTRILPGSLETPSGWKKKNKKKIELELPRHAKIPAKINNVRISNVQGGWRDRNDNEILQITYTRNGYRVEIIDRDTF